MAFESKRLRAARLALMLLASASLTLFAWTAPAFAQLPDIIVDVGDTTAVSGEKNTVISVYFSNYESRNTITAFNLWLQCDRSDILIFQTDVDTVVDTNRWLCLDVDCLDTIFVYGDTLFWRCDEYNAQQECTDSTLVPPDSTWDFWHLAEWDFWHIDTSYPLIGNFDATGTLISNWEHIETRSLSGMGYDLNIIGIADLPSGQETPGIAPQAGGLLIRLLADVKNVPDTLSDRAVNIMIQSDFLDHLNFSGLDGVSIGLLYEEVPDSNFWRCTQWAGMTCLNWQRVPTAPYDSIDVGVDTIAYLDTANVWLDDGKLTVLPPPSARCCYGDPQAYDCDDIIEWACDTLGGIWSPYATCLDGCPEGICGDVNGDFLDPVDISDLVYLVDYMFTDGPDPVPWWVADMDCSGWPIDITDLVFLVDYMFLAGPEPCDHPNCTGK